MTLALLMGLSAGWAVFEVGLALDLRWQLARAHESIQAASYEVAQDERRWADPAPGALPVRCFATNDVGLVVEFYGGGG